ncbi:MAG: DUF4331 family protein [Sandaracinus sp.]
MKANRPKLWALLVLVLGGAGAFAATQGAPAEAADHLDPPHRTNPAAVPTGTTADRAADIADVFAWTTGTDPATSHTVLALTFDGPNLPADLSALPCDPDVAYQLHIDTNGSLGDSTTFADEETITVRFGTDDADHCMVRFEGIPGTTIPLEGPIETTLSRGGATPSVQAFAGLRDDHFFFDLTGFQATLTSLSLSNVNDRDFFAGQNTPAIVVEFPTAALALGTAPIRVWASTARHN